MAGIAALLAAGIIADLPAGPTRQAGMAQPVAAVVFNGEWL